MAEVAFESPQEIAEKVSRYEEVFKYRYSEKEEGFHQAMQRSSRWYQVPVMSPWPPMRPRRRYQDWDSSHRYGYRSRERGWRSYHPRPRYYEERDRGYPRRHRSRSPYDRRSPRGVAHDREPSGYRERSRSPYSPGRYHYQHHGFHRSPSPPPAHYPPPPGQYPPPPAQYPPPPSEYPPPPAHHDYARRSRSRSPHWERSPRRDTPPHGRRDTPPHGRKDTPPHGRRELSPLARREAPSPRKKHPEEEGYTSDEKPPDDSKKPEKSEPQTNPLMELGFGDSEKKAAPSAIDVLDILSSAHAGANVITSQNLKKVQKEGQGQATRKEKGKSKTASAASGKGQSTLEKESRGNRGGPLSASSNLLISHGTTENVPTSLFERSGEAPPTVQHSGKEHKAQKRKKTKKKQKVVISDEESIDVVHAERLTWDSSGNTTAVVSGAAPNIYRETGSLILHVDKKFCSQVSAQTTDERTATVLDTGLFLDVGGTHDTSSQQSSLDTTRTSLDTTGRSLDTTGISLDTTGRSLDTIGRSLDTTGKSLDTIGRSLDTTGRFLDTTGKSFDTTGRSLDTTGKSFDTSSRSLDTTGKSFDTTGRSLDTIGKSLDTMFTSSCNDPSSGKLIIKTQGDSRSSSPANIEGEKKAKKKKKKSKHVIEETGKQLKLKITIGRAEPQ